MTLSKTMRNERFVVSPCSMFRIATLKVLVFRPQNWLQHSLFVPMNWAVIHRLSALLPRLVAPPHSLHSETFRHSLLQKPMPARPSSTAHLPLMFDPLPLDFAQPS